MERLAAFEGARRPRISFRSRLAISERRLLLISGDMLLIGSSIIGALLLWSIWAERPFSWSLWREQTLWALFVFSGWMLWLMLSNLYHLPLAVSIRDSTRRIVGGGIAIAIAYLVLFFVISPAPMLGGPSTLLSSLIPSGLLPRLAPGMAIISSILLLLLWRVTYALALSGPRAQRRVLILGAGNAGTMLCQEILREHSAHYHIVGFVDDDRSKQLGADGDIPILGDHTQLKRLAQMYHADEIVVAISSEVRGRLFQSIMDCHEKGITITPMPLLYERLTGKIAVEHIGSQWYIALPLQERAASTLFLAIKRLNDLVFGLIGVVALALAYPIVAVAIRLDSPGPIFYVQERAGMHGRSIRVRKFRSMVQNAEANGKAQWAVKNDDRITRIGRFLRKTRIDELPQVLNVLRGEMSIVGPRPERPEFIKELQHQLPFYRTRLATKPGLTGWAQVNYGYGSTVEDALIKLQYDLYYIKHQSPWLDLLIMLRTIGVVLRMKGQ
jgi:exopolysaccharide biosynthesis polyprenyl glycosylphosphotransferase